MFFLLVHIAALKVYYDKYKIHIKYEFLIGCKKA